MASKLGKRARATVEDRDHEYSASRSQRVKRRAIQREIGDHKQDLGIEKATGHKDLVFNLDHDKENVSQLLTPKTPRHRDALHQKIQVTPQSRRIFAKPRTPNTPRTPLTPSNATNTFSSARKLFALGADANAIIGRDVEKQELFGLLHKGIVSGQSQSLYMSGPPGTGKSAVIGELWHQLSSNSQVTSIYVNCMTLRSSLDLSKRLVDELAENHLDVPSNNLLYAKLENILLKRERSKAGAQTIVIILDEVDNLIQIDAEIVYKLFTWSLQKSNNFILISVANALDLTDRFLPGLKARNLRPKLLPFMPYTAGQIETIISTKLQSLVAEEDSPKGFIPFVQPAAIQLCAKKVASQTGDLRKAFSIIRRTIDAVESETIAKYQTQAPSKSPSRSSVKSPLGENPNLASPSTKAPQTQLATLTPLTAARATIAHVSRVAAAVLSHGTTQRLKSLNLQQKATLCALARHEARQRTTTASIFSTPSKSRIFNGNIRTLYNFYSASCRLETSLTPLSLTEFIDVVTSLESLGLVARDATKGASARNTPSKRVREENMALSSLVSRKEIEECLDGPGAGILRSLLNDV